MSNDPLGCFDDFNPTGVCPGYGYNDGLVSDSGYGLLQTQIVDSGGNNLRPGRNISQIVSPGSMVAFGDSADTGTMSISVDSIYSTYPDGYSSSMLRHTQLWNFCFVQRARAHNPHGGR